MDARNSHMLNPGATITSHFTAAASYYTQDGEALFALANSLGNILLVKMPPLDMQGNQWVFQHFIDRCIQGQVVRDRLLRITYPSILWV